LTLYLHNECNLRCQYCFSAPSPAPAARLSLPAMAAAARLVLPNCRAQGRPLVAVFHGGGEPALHLPLLLEALDLLEGLADAYGVPLFRYIATNGVLPASTAVWIGQRFDRVGLSCDGPPEIQDAQRPQWGGQATAGSVERTAAIVREHGAALHVRATVTPATADRQAEIAAYLCQALQPEEIHVEADYRAGRAGSGPCFAGDQADLFVAGFLAAQAVASAHGVAWRNSGSRLDELHGPFCNVLREVIHLVPGDAAVACFLDTDASQAGQRQAVIGRLVGDRLVLDDAAIHALRQRLAGQPARCKSCFNQFHCARACPEACALADASDFLCRLRQQLAHAHLHWQAEQMWRAQGCPASVIGAPAVP
jgi:sulfatase maturation enzyme AslB (radical SAM superfamily)